MVILSIQSTHTRSNLWRPSHTRITVSRAHPKPRLSLSLSVYLYLSLFLSPVAFELPDRTKVAHPQKCKCLDFEKSVNERLWLHCRQRIQPAQPKRMPANRKDKFQRFVNYETALNLECRKQKRNIESVLESTTEATYNGKATTKFVNKNQAKILCGTKRTNKILDRTK